MNRIPLTLFFCSAFGIFPLHAATPIPTWYPGPDATRQGYIFDDNSLTPVPTIDGNPNGTALTSITLGQFAAGWQQSGSDPSNIALNGVDRDGAWDLGISGNMRTVVEIAPGLPAPGSFYRVEFLVYAVAYQDLSVVPLLDAAGLTPVNLQRTQSTVANDTVFLNASWEGVTWAGYFDNVVDTSLAFGIKAPSNGTSVVDTYEVFTRTTLIPEPSTSILCTGGLLALALRRRRKLI